MINIKVFDDLFFVAVGWPGEYSADFKVYNLFGLEADGTLEYEKDSRPIDNIADASVYLHGHVKWDGCSNWHFDEQDSCMLHGCDRQDLVALGEIMARCWDWASTLCEYWNP